MNRSRWLLAACCLLLLGGLPAPHAAAEDALAGPHALDDGMQAARHALLHGDVKKAAAAFQTLLEAHKPKDYAKARKGEIERLLMELACGTKHKRPKMKDLLGGTLKRWSAETGTFLIVYTPSTSKNLETRAGMTHIPARLNGPFSLEIKGASYPTSDSETPRIVFGGDEDPESGNAQSWTASFSTPKKSRGRAAPKVTAKLVQVDGSKETTLSERSASVGKPGKPYKLVTKFSKKKITLTLAARSFGNAKKLKPHWGFLAFRAGGWTDLKLSGTIDPAWIHDRLEEVFRVQLADFEETFDASSVVPGWLGEPLRRDESRPDRKPVDLVARLDSKHYDLFLEVDNAIRADEFEDALTGVDTMQKAGVPEATCEFMRAQLRQRMTQLEQALVHLKRVVELEPDFLDGVLLRGSLLRQLGRYDEALATFQKATGVYAQFPSAYAEAASSMLYAGRPEAAAKITQAAARNGVYSEKLLTLKGALDKVVRGPRWRKRFEHKSRNYHVISNIDQPICREAAKLLEDAFAAYREKIGPVPKEQRRLFKVYLFSTLKGFVAYQGDLTEFMGKPTDQAAGLYSPLLKQLLIWNLPSRADMLETIRHEGFHQYLDRVMPNPPVWFNEGLAVYHQNGKMEDGKLTFGHLHPRFIQLLKNRGMMPLKKFLTSGPGLFYEDGLRSYGQGWLLVHMLQHTSTEYRKLFQDMMDGLRTGSAFDTVRKAFPDAALPKIEKDMRAYLEKLANR